jgi:hypothetical protein
MAQHLYREELTEDQKRERVIEALCDMSIGAHLICQKAGLPIGTQAGIYILHLPECFCPEKHVVASDSDHPDLERMQILGTHVFCPIHKRKFDVRQLLDLLPLGKRKTQAKRDALLAKINIVPQPERFYVYQSGVDFETTGMSTDPREAESQVTLSPKVQARGMLLEVADARRARQILETMSGELPFKNLADDIRDDLTLVANWHGAQLSPQEKMTLHTQQLESAKTKRKARQKLVEQMRRDADRLVIEPL